MAENTSMVNKDAGQGFSQREYNLIQELVKERMENKQDLPYESFEGYEIPPRTQFSMIKKPAVSIKGNMMTFNTASVRLFEGIQYVIPMLNRTKQRLAIIPCSEEESASVEWARKKDGKWVSKAVTSPDFVNILFREMGWDSACRYKILGDLCLSSRGLILVFDLSEAIMFTPQTEYVDSKTGARRKRTMKFYADKYRDRIGMSYSDYETAKQMNMLDDLSGYEETDSVLPPYEENSDSDQMTVLDEKSKTGEMEVQPESIHQSASNLLYRVEEGMGIDRQKSIV